MSNQDYAQAERKAKERLAESGKEIVVFGYMAGGVMFFDEKNPMSGADFLSMCRGFYSDGVSCVFAVHRLPS